MSEEEKRKEFETYVAKKISENMRAIMDIQGKNILERNLNLLIYYCTKAIEALDRISKIEDVEEWQINELSDCHYTKRVCGDYEDEIAPPACVLDDFVTNAEEWLKELAEEKDGSV